MVQGKTSIGSTRGAPAGSLGENWRTSWDFRVIPCGFYMDLTAIRWWFHRMQRWIHRIEEVFSLALNSFTVGLMRYYQPIRDIFPFESLQIPGSVGPMKNPVLGFSSWTSPFYSPNGLNLSESSMTHHCFVVFERIRSSGLSWWLVIITVTIFIIKEVVGFLREKIGSQHFHLS